MASALRFLIAVAALLSLANSAQLIPDKYIVTFKQTATDSDIARHYQLLQTLTLNLVAQFSKQAQLGGVQRKYFFTGFAGYAGTFNATVLALIKQSPVVQTVEQDQIVTVNSAILGRRGLATQSGATWGLATLAHHSPGQSTFIYDNTAGAGTFAYIVDTGVLATHTQFGGRASVVYNAAGGNNTDTLGHGTHVAGIIGGSTYGVAKSTTLLSVKVFNDGSASLSVLLDGYNWAVNDIIAKRRKTKSAINMSLGGSYSDAINSAVKNAFTQGVITVVAAGNDGASAAGYSPASAPNAVTVGAIDSNWAQASYSNYGSLLDIYAPGSNILSAWIGSDTTLAYLSGTSMATPHVTGLLLYLMAKESLGSPTTATSRLKQLGTMGKGKNITAGSPNLIPYNGNGAQ